jgi:hypothetical protein
MKVRWTSESLRARITPTELLALQRGEHVVERVALAGGAWEVRLVPGAATFALTSDRGAVLVGLPSAEVTQLAAPDREGIYTQDGPLRLLVEKDFPCAHPHTREAAEPETERFAPTDAFLARRGTRGG